ncbi:catalase [Porphyrobacter sp. AAP60]|uniref:catalase n=1 Tax=Porphyrobacter sp. AAP60 TaxID=1523423 RepID=UPI0012E0D320|nr:catalase [Porphyrobacter sp. AAP60]
MFCFDHELILGRIVHARGSGARHEVTRKIPKWTRAELFQAAGTTRPVFVWPNPQLALLAYSLRSGVKPFEGRKTPL